MATLGPCVDRARASSDAEFLTKRSSDRGYGWWVAEVKEGMPFAGFIVANEISYEVPFTPTFEIGWRLAAEAWGFGYATEGARALLAFAFDRLGRDEVVAMTAKINDRSQRVMQRLGMTYDPADDFSHPRVAADSPLHPHVLYRIKASAPRLPFRPASAI